MGRRRAVRDMPHGVAQRRQLANLQVEFFRFLPKRLAGEVQFAALAEHSRDFPERETRCLPEDDPLQLQQHVSFVLTAEPVPRHR